MKNPQLGRIYYFTKDFYNNWFCSGIGAETYPTIDAAQKEAVSLMGMGDIHIPVGYADGSFQVGDLQNK